MANTMPLTVVTGLPHFSGVPRANEPYFKSELTAKNFIEVLENYFSSQLITSEDLKISMFYNMIDHTKGDALTLIPCFKGAGLKTFLQVKDQFLAFYESGRQTEFQPAAKIFMSINLKDDTKGNLTKLNTVAKNIAEAYVSSNNFLGKDYDIETILANETMPYPPGEQRYSVGAKGPIKLVDVLQNLLMHTVIAAHTHKKVCEKVGEFGPDTPSTKLMTYTNKIIHDHPIPEMDKVVAKNEDTVWKATTPINNNTQTTHKENPRYTRPNKYPQTTRTHYRDDNNQVCTNCDKRGHTRRECRICAYCKKSGHTARMCEARIKNAKGKYCTHCKLKDSHDTQECYRGGRTLNKNGPRNVRMLREYPEDEGTTYDNEWSPNNCDYRNEQPSHT